MRGRASGLTALVLGAAAGGGFPQWNCGCHLCCLARSGDPRVRAATQASIAVTGNETDWLVVGASPDLRQQIMQNPRLWPAHGPRHSPLAAVVLLGGDVDAIAGLLVLRERQPFTVYAPVPLLDLLRQNNIFDVLDPAIVRQEPIVPDRAGEMPRGDCADPARDARQGSALSRKPRRHRRRARPDLRRTPGRQRTQRHHGAGLCRDHRRVCDSNCATPTCVFFDGTLFTDDEMIAEGLGEKTGRRMGHVPVSGPGGTLEGLSDLPGRRVLLHINNSNPILLRDSPERRQVEAAGFEVAFDGMEVVL